MSSYSKASKQDEKEFEEYTITAKKQEEAPAAKTTSKKKTPSLKDALKEASIDMNAFAVMSEEKRKKVLGEDYQDIKNEEGWLYDNYCGDGKHWDPSKQKCVSD